MKNSLKYLKLWQRKRSELQVNDDEQKDWLEMQSVLDQHMPVSAEDEEPSRSKGFKLLSLLLVTMSAAAMTFVFTYKIATKNHSHNINHHRGKKQTALNINRLSKDTIADSLTANGIAINKKDSLSLTKPSGNIKNANITGASLGSKSGNTSSNILSDTSNIFSGNGSSAPSKKNYLLPSIGQNSKQLIPQGKNQPAIANNYSNKSMLAPFDKNQPAVASNHNNKSILAPLAANKVSFGKPAGESKNNSPSVTAINGGQFQPGNLRTGVGHHHAIRNKNGYYPADKSDSNDKSDGNNYKSDNNSGEHFVLLVAIPKPGFSLSGNNLMTAGKPVLNYKIGQTPIANKSSNNKKASDKEKNIKVKNSSSSNIDWGLLTGVNSSGSFTLKNQNSNFYGNSPVDLYFGLFATYNINDKWAVNSQIRLLSPQTITNTYTHANASKIDSSQLLQITSSRKMYSVSIPLHAVYKVNNNLSFIAGPVINIPVKQINASSTWLPTAIRSDSTYSAHVDSVLNRTKYEQKINFGLSAGVDITFKRLSFGATYMKSLSGYQVSSDFGNHKSYNGTFQFTIGFRLNKSKP